MLFRVLGKKVARLLQSGVRKAIVARSAVVAVDRIVVRLEHRPDMCQVRATYTVRCADRSKLAIVLDFTECPLDFLEARIDGRKVGDTVANDGLKLRVWTAATGPNQPTVTTIQTVLAWRKSRRISPTVLLLPDSLPRVWLREKGAEGSVVPLPELELQSEANNEWCKVGAPYNYNDSHSERLLCAAVIPADSGEVCLEFQTFMVILAPRMAASVDAQGQGRIGTLISSAYQFIRKTCDLPVLSGVVTCLPNEVFADARRDVRAVALEPDMLGASGSASRIQDVVVVRMILLHWLDGPCRVRGVGSVELVNAIGAAVGLAWMNAIGEQEPAHILYERYSAMSKGERYSSWRDSVEQGVDLAAYARLVLQIYDRHIVDREYLETVGRFVRANWGRAVLSGELRSYLSLA